MSIHWNEDKVVKVATWSSILYLLVFQAWKVFLDYPEGVLQQEYSPVGIFKILPGPLSESNLDIIFYLWPAFLVLSLAPKISRVGLIGSFILGCYVLGYAYNYGRIFHGSSLILQVLLLLALGSKRRPGITIMMAQFLIGMAYFSSGVSKLVRSGFEWALSENLAIILHTQPLSTPLQNYLLNLPSLALQAVALFILVIELTSLLPLAIPGLRLFYVMSWSIFHIGVTLAMGGHTTFFSHLFLFPFFLIAPKILYGRDP